MALSAETMREVQRLAADLVQLFTPPELIPGCEVKSVADKDEYATDNGWIEAVVGPHNQQRCRWRGQYVGVQVGDYVDVLYFASYRLFVVFGQGGVGATPAGGKVYQLWESDGGAVAWAVDADGDLSGDGEIYADGGTAGQGLNERLEDISGDKIVGNYGYNPVQLIVPNSTWLAGSTDGSGRDDFFRDNIDGAGLDSWDIVSGCTPEDYNVDIDSFLMLRAGSTSETNQNHAIIRTDISGHSVADFYWARLSPYFVLGSTYRVGLVMMQSDLLKGAAIWYKYDSTNGYQIECATYSDASAWLSHANATDSNVAYTTGWTSRYTSAYFTLVNATQYPVAMRDRGSVLTRLEFYHTDANGLNSQRLANPTGTWFTPAYLYLFVEGNTASPTFGIFDNTGRNIYAVI